MGAERGKKGTGMFLGWQIEADFETEKMPVPFSPFFFVPFSPFFLGWQIEADFETEKMPVPFSPSVPVPFFMSRPRQQTNPRRP
jgi:hypothetical protein